MTRSLPVFADLRAFLGWNEAQGDLVRIADPVALRHQMTAVQVAALERAGPVLRFDAAIQADGGGRPCRWWPTCLAPRTGWPPGWD